VGGPHQGIHRQLDEHLPGAPGARRALPEQHGDAQGRARRMPLSRFLFRPAPKALRPSPGLCRRVAERKTQARTCPTSTARSSSTRACAWPSRPRRSRSRRPRTTDASRSSSRAVRHRRPGTETRLRPRDSLPRRPARGLPNIWAPTPILSQSYFMVLIVVTALLASKTSPPQIELRSSCRVSKTHATASVMADQPNSLPSRHGGRSRTMAPKV
jgi:hypothetical protein